MDDAELFEGFRDILQETPEVEDALREWRDRQARAAIKRQLARRRTEILVKCYGGYEPSDDNSDGTR